MHNFYVFIGRSGCGKGTQAELLRKNLQEKNADRATLYLGTGDEFRKFFEESGYTQDLSRKIYDRGGLQPEFLAIHMWSHFLITRMTEESDVILDGAPRILNEARSLDSAFEFYGGKVFVLYINVSREWARGKLLARGRSDDTKEEVEKRLDWYEEEVAPVVEFYRTHPAHKFLDINGDQAIPEVHAEIVDKLASF